MPKRPRWERETLPSQTTHNLTATQQLILETAISRGVFAPNELGRLLSYSPRTVKNAWCDICQKLGARNRTDAVMLYMRRASW